jgi:hypothetical protein
MEGWGSEIYVLHTKSVDQIQQNLIKPTNHKKFGRAIFVGIFEIGTKQSKIRLENYGGRLQNRDQRGS